MLNLSMLLMLLIMTWLPPAVLADEAGETSKITYRHAFGDKIPINDAITWLRKEVVAQPDNEGLKFSLVVLLALQIEQKNGVQKEGIFAQSDTEDLEGLVAWSMYNFKKGNLAQAQEYLELAIKEQISFPMAYNSLAYIYGKTGQLEKAIALLEEGKSRWKHESPFYFNQAFNFIVQGNKDKAIQNMEIVVQLNSKDEEALFLLGGLYLEKKRYQKGREILEKLLVLNPQHVHAILQIALLSHIEGDTETALALIKKAANIDPNNQENAKLIRQYQKGVQAERKK